jgi:DNA polymerase-3 subunit delta
MIIFLHGEDTFRVHQRFGALQKRFKEKFDPSGLNVSELREGVNLAEVISAASSAPFLAEKRMVVVRGVYGKIKKKEREFFDTALKKIPSSAVLVFVEGAVEPLPSEIIGVETHVYGFPLLKGQALSAWIRARVKELKAEMHEDALQEMAARVGSDLWRMDAELTKLCFRTPITLDHVHSFVHATFEDQMFAFVDAVSQRNVSLAMRLLEEERARGADDMHIFSMLARQARILLAVRVMLEEKKYTTAAEAAKTLGLHPFVAGKALRQAQGFHLEQLKRVHEQFFCLDRDVKVGGIDVGLAVELSMAFTLQAPFSKNNVLV